MISIADATLSLPCRTRLLEAISALGKQVISNDEILTTPPQLLVGGLGAGERRLSPALLAASERWPHAPLLVACDEELVQPVTRLQGGRLTLISQDLAPISLGHTLLNCLSWSEVAGAAAPASKSPSEADHEHWSARVVVGSGPEVPQATMIHGRCLSAWLRPSESAHLLLPTAAMDAWSREAIAQRLSPLAALAIAPVPQGIGAGVHLDPDGLALVQVVGPHWQFILSAEHRLPSWYSPSGSQAIATHAGDVLILAWTQDERPIPVLGGSGLSIAHELARRWQGLAATALIIEVR